MEEPNEEHNVIPGQSSASKYDCKDPSIVCARSCNGSFPGFRALLSDSEISFWRTPEGNCKGKLVQNTSE